MANQYYEAGPNRAARVRDLFGAIARRYDLINDLQSLGWHRVWKRRLVRLAEPEPGEAAVDVCCGTGDIALGLAACGVRVVGVDFSEPMIEVARRRSEPAVNARAGGPSGGARTAPQFLRGDALALPFADQSFEIVTIGYGLRNLVSWEGGLAEMCRVAKPGGRLLLLDFGKPEQGLWRRLYFAYLRSGVPIWGKLLCGNAQAYAYILESLRHYPASAGVARKLAEMGAGEVRVWNLLGGVMSITYARKVERVSGC